ncbi:radical SAM protein [bacterium]|nr:radical SAM protein [bacterium]
MNAYPSYLGISDKDWSNKEDAARRLISDCRCCPRYCHADREGGKKGMCRAGSKPVIASADAHFGEEPPISGYKGSGTIFFTYCPMKCVYCQNYPFSQLGHGKEKGIEELASLMIYLQEKGCHNINLVTPTHFVPQILFAVRKAMDMGLKIPLVYNTSSYDSIESLSLMEGVVDIYLADLRYADPEKSEKYSGARDYPQASMAAVKEMYRQTGPLELDKEGIASRGLLIRHLVLPNRIAGTKDVFKFIAGDLSKKVPVSLMSQYFPAYLAPDHTGLNRRITRQEYDEALGWLDESGLAEGWRQDI